MAPATVILVILDGLGDRPVPALGGNTPLQHARTPVLDALAAAGACGIMDVVAPGRPLGSDLAHLILLGYDPITGYPGRGPLEALGVGFDLDPRDIAFRGNLAHVNDDKIILDRRAGRDIPEAGDFIDAIDPLRFDDFPGVEFRVRHSTEQRVACVLRGPGMSERVSSTSATSNLVPVADCVPLDASGAARGTAAIINRVGDRVHEILNAHPANRVRAEKGLPLVNAMLFYGFGRVMRVPSVHDKFGISAGCVTGNGLIRGVCRHAGIEVIPCKGATGTKNTDLDAKVAALLSNIDRFDLLFLHVKATDSTGHDKQPFEKASFLERVDGALGRLVDQVDLSSTSIIVTADHSTPCTVGDHSDDPVPVLVRGPGFTADGVDRFDEVACARGSLGRFRGTTFMDLVVTAAGTPASR